MNCFATLLLLLFTGVTTAASATTPKLRGAEGDNSPLLCLIVQAHETGDNGNREYFMCELILEKNGTVLYGLNIDLPEEVVANNQDALYRGEWFVNITGASVEETLIEGHGMVRTSISVPRAATITTVSPENGKKAMLSAKGITSSEEGSAGERRLATSGTRTVLILRVSVSDASPSFSSQQLADDFFDDSFSVATQYNGCSFGALQFKAYDPSNPVVDVVIQGRASSFTSSTLWQLAMAAGASQKGVSYLTNLAQHVAIVVPPGLSDSGWYASGSVGGWWSLYNDKWGGFPNFGVHELGHNLGMGHAGVGGDPYADSSDVMGYGDPQQYGISKCFNGYHYWYLGWLASRSIDVDPYTHNVLTLAAFSDYDMTKSNQYVVIKVDSYYIVYNRATGINAGVNDVPDTVTVAQATSGVFSIRVAALSTGSSSIYRVNNFGGGSQSLNIVVCSIVNGGAADYAVVSIGVGVTDCSGGIAFTQSTPVPSNPPVPPPTPRPTPRKPTPNPARPTRAPVVPPTLPPTLPPVPTTSKPTLARRRRPTQSPALSGRNPN